MCYNTCNHANFNPSEGEESCTLPKDGNCPMDEKETTEEDFDKLGKAHHNFFKMTLDLTKHS